MSNPTTILYVFTGSVISNGALKAELMACMHMWQVLGSIKSIKQNEATVICTDSKNLVDMSEKAITGMIVDRQGFTEIKKFVDSFPNCVIKYVNKKWNKSADLLAKQGREID